MNYTICDMCGCMVKKNTFCQNEFCTKKRRSFFDPGGVIRVSKDYFKYLNMPTEPKQRTIEEVQIGDKVEFSSSIGGKVIEVFTNSFIVEATGGTPVIYSFEMAKRRNGKIKQPEPEKKEEVCIHCGK